MAASIQSAITHSKVQLDSQQPTNTASKRSTPEHACREQARAVYTCCMTTANSKEPDVSAPMMRGKLASDLAVYLDRQSCYRGMKAALEACKDVK